MSKLKLTLVAVSCLLFMTLTSYSQNLNIPQTEFSIATDDSLAIETGSFKKLGVWVLRSKSFLKTNVRMSVSSALPEGVQVNFLPGHGQFDYCEATISVNPATKPGTYLIIVSGTINYKTKGQVVKLTVPPPVISSNLR